MTGFSQGSREKICYRQSIKNDTIESAVWSISPEGPALTGQYDDDTSSQIPVSGLRVNPSLLVCHIVGTSGQEYEGTAEISVPR